MSKVIWLQLLQAIKWRLRHLSIVLGFRDSGCRDQPLPRAAAHPAREPATACVKSSTEPCRIYRSNFRHSSRCNEIIFEILLCVNHFWWLHSYTDGPMSSALTCILGQICTWFWFWGLTFGDVTICATYSNSSWWTKTYKTVHASLPIQATYKIMGQCSHDG